MVTRIFVSYATADESFRAELEKHLAPLRRAGAVDVWNEHDIDAEELRHQRIAAQISAADVGRVSLSMRARAALLVSLIGCGCASGETFVPDTQEHAVPDDEPSLEVSFSCPPGSPEVVQLALSQTFSHALLSDGTVWCWGRCLEAWDDPEKTTTVPIRVNVEGVVRIGSGVHHACAVLEDGTVRCWGWNPGGEVGVDAKYTYIPIDKPVQPNIAGVADIGGGLVQSCALRYDGTVACWGWPYVFFPLDEPFPPDITSLNDPHPEPVEIPGIKGADRLSVGSYMTCVRIPGDMNPLETTLRCFGGLPMPDLSGEKTPIRVFAASVYDVCLVDALGKARCHASYDSPPVSDSVAPAWNGAAELDVSDRTMLGCARFGDGRVRCAGELTQHTYVAGWLKVPESLDPVPGIYNATHIAVSDAHGCAIDDGCVRCWGHNEEGQLGDGTYQTSVVPRFVNWQ